MGSLWPTLVAVGQEATMKEIPFRNTSGRPRPCAICNSQRVKESKVCQDCQKTWGVRLKEPWAVEAIRHSDNQARLVRQIREKERPLLYSKE